MPPSPQSCDAGRSEAWRPAGTITVVVRGTAFHGPWSSWGRRWRSGWWERDTTFIALLRAAMTSEVAAGTMRAVFATQVAPALAKVAPDNPGPRAALIGSLVLGMATTRYILKAPAAAGLGHEELIRWARPVIRDLLVGPPPG